jgi:predicted outer membrane repeat protein
VTTVTLTTGRLQLLIGMAIQGGETGVTIQRSSAPGTPEFPIFDISVTSIGVKATLQGLTISNGKTSGSGGGIAIGFGSVALIDTTVSGNTAAVDGGGIAASGAGTLSLTNSTISGNVAGQGGGGISNGPGSENDPFPDFNWVILTNSTISGNTARFVGGGIHMNSGTLILTSSTLVRNTAAYGEGVVVEDETLDTRMPLQTTMMLRQSIVAGNGVRDCATTSGRITPLTSQGYNLVGSGTGCPSDGTGDQVLTGPLDTAVNPELANNGGPTMTHMPVHNGPAYNWIPPAECIPTTDQRGIDRPRYGACDVGAVEYAPMATLTTAPVGPGSVSRSPTGIGGGLDTHPDGTAITFTAQPSRGAIFTGWLIDGAPHGWANPLTVTAGNVQEIQAIFTPPVTFPDVPVGRGDRTAIVELASRGTIRGYQNGNFGPDDGVTRAQMAALIARAMPAGPGIPPEFVSPPACVNADTWDCEAWDNHFTDQSGVGDALWRDVAALQQHRVAYGYGTVQCAARGLAAPCFGPNDPVTYAQTISFIARAMREKGYWIDQPDASLPYEGIPDAHATDVRTFHFYTQSLGGIPIPPGDWDAPATRGWFAQSLWVALDSYWGAAEP